MQGKRIKRLLGDELQGAQAQAIGELLPSGSNAADRSQKTFYKAESPVVRIAPGVFRSCSLMSPSRHLARHIAVAKDECEHTMLPVAVFAAAISR